MKVDTGLFPLTLDSSFADALHGGDLGERKTAEKFEVNDL
jgi:hypothetical protein